MTLSDYLLNFYLFTFRISNTFSWLKNQKIRQIILWKVSLLPVSCHPVVLPSSNQTIDYISLLNFSRDIFCNISNYKYKYCYCHFLQSQLYAIYIVEELVFSLNRSWNCLYTKHCLILFYGCRVYVVEIHCYLTCLLINVSNLLLLQTKIKFLVVELLSQRECPFKILLNTTTKLSSIEVFQFTFPQTK